jgi:hypothetical protein
MLVAITIVVFRACGVIDGIYQDWQLLRCDGPQGVNQLDTKGSSGGCWSQYHSYIHIFSTRRVELAHAILDTSLWQIVVRRNAQKRFDGPTCLFFYRRDSQRFLRALIDYNKGRLGDISSRFGVASVKINGPSMDSDMVFHKLCFYLIWSRNAH